MKAKEIEKRLINVERKYRQLEYMMDLDGSTKRAIEAMEEAYKHEKELNELTCNNLKSLAIKQIENEKKEEVKYEARIPLFEKGELKYFDCNMHSIIESLLETKLKEKDHILFQRIIKKQEEEIKYLRDLNSKYSNQIDQYILLKDEALEYIDKAKTYPYIEKIYIKDLEAILNKEVI